MIPRPEGKDKIDVNEVVATDGPEALRTVLRKAKRLPEFRRRYRAELAGHSETLNALRCRARKGPITLVYAARDDIQNHAIVLRDAILERKEHSNDA